MDLEYYELLKEYLEFYGAKLLSYDTGSQDLIIKCPNMHTYSLNYKKCDGYSCIQCITNFNNEPGYLKYIRITPQDTFMIIGKHNREGKFHLNKIKMSAPYYG